MYKDINFNKLREDLMDYFGCSMFAISGFAIMELVEVEKASNEELINIAIKNGFDLNKYKRNKTLSLHI